MPRKKPENKVVEVDFGNKKVVPNFDFSFIFEGDNFWFTPFGLHNGQELQFKIVDDFFDGDFIALVVENSYQYGFGYYLSNSILIGMNDYKPVPRKDIKLIGKLLTPIELSRAGNFERRK